MRRVGTSIGRQVAEIAAAAAAACLAAAATAAAEPTPIPLRAPTGYRDYCDGMKRGKNYPCPRGGVPQALWRPLHLPTLAAEASCPAATPHTVTNRIAPVLGPGPVYFVAGGYNRADRATMTAPYPPPEAHVAFGTGWTAAKAPLVMKKTFAQPMVVRGRRIDGAGDLGFSGSGRRPFGAMQFPAAGPTIDLGRYKAHSLNVWAATPGCYALQIDGATFSRVVVFRVEFSDT